MLDSGQPRAIQRANVYELVAERLLSDIGDGVFRAGMALPSERELAERFGVGRSSIREALRVMESHGVVRSDRHAQFVVRDEAEMLIPSVSMLVTLGYATLADVHELRTALEIEIAGLAAVRRSAEDIDAIAAAMRRTAETQGSRESTMEADLAFHGAIAAAANNRALVVVSTAVCVTLSGALRSSYHVSPEAAVQHAAVAEAITAGNVEAARHAAQAHMDWITSIIPLENGGARGDQT